MATQVHENGARPVQAWQRLGPGLITGAADDDPSGIATYSQAGAQFGYSLGWTQNGTNAPTSMHGRLLKNGATEVLPSASRASNNAADTGKIIICTEGIISLTAGDTLQLQHKFSSLDGYASANITRFWVEQLT